METWMCQDMCASHWDAVQAAVYKSTFVCILNTFLVAGCCPNRHMAFLLFYKIHNFYIILFYLSQYRHSLAHFCHNGLCIFNFINNINPLICLIFGHLRVYHLWYPSANAFFANFIIVIWFSSFNVAAKQFQELYWCIFNVMFDRRSNNNKMNIINIIDRWMI